MFNPCAIGVGLDGSLLVILEPGNSGLIDHECFVTARDSE